MKLKLYRDHSLYLLSASSSSFISSSFSTFTIFTQSFLVLSCLVLSLDLPVGWVEHSLHSHCPKPRTRTSGRTGNLSTQLHSLSHSLYLSLSFLISLSLSHCISLSILPTLPHISLFSTSTLLQWTSTQLISLFS